MKLVKKLAAPLSILITLVLIIVTFHAYFGVEEQPPVLMNTQFKVFTLDPYTNTSRPYLWEVVYYSGPNDVAFVQKDIVDNELCLGLHVYQDGTNDTHDWVSIHVKQELRGSAFERAFNNDIVVWVYPTFSYKYFQETGDPRNVFGIEINDGVHILWFVFSDKNTGVFQIKNHRIVVIETPLNQWSPVTINIGREYEEAGWKIPTDASFILILGATKHDVGWRAGYFKEIIIQETGEES